MCVCVCVCVYKLGSFIRQMCCKKKNSKQDTYKWMRQIIYNFT